MKNIIKSLVTVLEEKYDIDFLVMQDNDIFVITCDEKVIADFREICKILQWGFLIIRETKIIIFTY